MLIVSALAVYKICESFTHNPLTQAHCDPGFLSLIVINKECKANTRKFEYNFRGGQHSCTFIAMENK